MSRPIVLRRTAGVNHEADVDLQHRDRLTWVVSGPLLRHRRLLIPAHTVAVTWRRPTKQFEPPHPIADNLGQGPLHDERPRLVTGLFVGARPAVSGISWIAPASLRVDRRSPAAGALKVGYIDRPLGRARMLARLDRTSLPHKIDREVVIVADIDFTKADGPFRCSCNTQAVIEGFIGNVNRDRAAPI